MPTHPRVAIAVLFGLSLLGMSSIGHASSYPAVLHRALPAAGLPNTPAYRTNAVVRDLARLNGDRASRTVNVVVDSAQRMARLAAYAAAATNPANPLFHHFLTPKALDGRFGPTSAMLGQAEAAMQAAGWHVVGHRGLVVTATVPGSSHHPGLPVSPNIWSLTDLSPHGLMRSPITATPVRAKASSTSGTLPTSVKGMALSMSGENFNQAPDVIQQTTEANGDVVSVMSWNPAASSSVPAGLPINLFVTVQDPQGNFLPIKNVGNLNDSYSSLVSYGTSSMPSSSDTLWQMPIAAWKDIRAGDLLTLSVSLPGGAVLNASFPLPAFTGPATVLTPLDAQQLNAVSGLSTMPANPGDIALFAIGSPPSLSDLSLYLAQNSINTTPPSVTFKYEDGATANEYGQPGDSQESQLDLEAAAGAAPGAPIIDYVYPENDANDPLISFLTDLSQQSSVKIANLSYGFFGENLTTLTSLMNALTAEGVTVLEASGDQGAWDAGNDPGPIGISSLEQVPQVLTMGGVDLAAAAKTDSYGDTLSITGSLISDGWGGDFLNGIPVAVAQTYTNANAASSGGYSTTTPIPSWQQGFLPASASGLGIPVMASLAGFPGMSGYLQGQNVIFGGTSLASPLTAGWLDEAEAALTLGTTGMGNINPLLFAAAGNDPSIFNQSLWGQDGVYSITDTQAGSWNPITGLGMMNWAGFLSDYTQLVPQTAASLALSVSPGVLVGQLAQASAFVRGMVNPIFQFAYRSPQNGRWTTSGPFSPTSTFSFSAKVPGIYDVRVEVKSVTGASMQADQVISSSTRLPMVSSLSVSSSLTGTVLKPHQKLVLTARAGDTGHQPEYQFSISGNHIKPHIVKGWSPRGILTVNSLPPGSYSITVEALDHTEIVKHNWAAAYRQTISFRVS